MLPCWSRPARQFPPREMVFVIDNSGSMGGTSMASAKDSLLYALGTLRPQDRFNVIRFDDTLTRLFDDSVPATPEQIASGQPWPVDLAADLKAPVLGLYGEQDRGIPLASVEAMRAALQPKLISGRG